MKRAWIIFAVTLLAYLLTASGHLYSPDEEILFRTTRALATGKGLAIEPLGGFATRRPDPPRPDGLEYAQYGIGQPILAVPFYWAGAVLGRVGTDRAWQLFAPRDPFGYRDLVFKPTAAEIAPRWIVSFFNIFLGAAMAALLYLVCLELTGRVGASTGAALLYALGSLAWPHSRPFFTESCAAFFVLLSLYGLLRALRGRVLPWCALAGAAAGYAALVRMDSTLAYPGLAIVLLGPIVNQARERGQSFWPAWIAFALPALVAGGVLLGLNWLHFGGPLESGYSDQPEGVDFSTPLLAGLFGFLFSVGKGVFFFSPALALGLAGWRPLARLTRRRHPALVWAIALIIVVQLVVHAKWQNWPGGWCWGPRHIFGLHPFLAIPVAAWLAVGRWTPAKRVLTLVALLVGVGVQLLGASQDFIYFHHRFYRAPGDITGAYVVYDPMDEQYWSQYFQLEYRPSIEQPFRLIRLVPPRPIQDSIYLPQNSVWNGYPVMLREGTLDNFWVHLASDGDIPAQKKRRGR